MVAIERQASEAARTVLCKKASIESAPARTITWKRAPVTEKVLRCGMICPNPNCPGRTEKPAEYREGVTTCHDCGTPLVEGNPEADEVEYEPFVSVLTIADASLVPIVKSLLSSENIRFFIKGEGVQDLFGSGRLGSGFSIITGPPVVYVEPDRAEEARELLAEVESVEPENDESPSDNPA
jgi:hypothetical protein